VRVVGECADGESAVRAIRASRPDLVFLDVQMPGLDAFDVIEEVGARTMPPVIFVTAYDEYACRAFEVHAVDYLLKPIDPLRFADALDRALLAASGNRPLDAGAVERLLASLRSPQPDQPSAAPKRIVVRDSGRVTFIDPATVDWIEAAGNFVRIHAAGRSHLHRATMDSMEAMLGELFVRVRRSALVRIAAIAWCEPYGRSSWVLVLRSGARIISSRYFMANLRRLFGETD
jgi:two-component system LytT family response regulator